MVQATVLSEPAPSARRLRLLVLASKPAGLSPGQRFRLEQWTPRLARDHAIDLTHVPFESPRLTELLYQAGHRPQKAAWVLYDFARRGRPVLQARGYDGVVIFREAALIGPALWERALAALDVPIFFDFDDAIWHPNQISKANGVFSRLHFFGKTRTICRLSTGVLAGNDYLADFARGYNSNVVVIPTSIDVDRYRPQPEDARADRFVVSWSGSTSTLAHFEHARGPLERLAAERPVTVKVICNEPPATPIAGAENVFVPWSEHDEVIHLGAAHAGIMPLPDNDYTRGKCGLKGLQYMAVGRPVVMSPVGMNRDLVRHDENGLLATSDDEWVTALRRLADEPLLRARLGAAGRRTVEEGYSAEVVAAKFARAVRQSLASAS